MMNLLYSDLPSAVFEQNSFSLSTCICSSTKKESTMSSMSTQISSFELVTGDGDGAGAVEASHGPGHPGTRVVPHAGAGTAS